MEQGFQPAFVTLAVTVEEGQHIARGNGRPQQPRPHQPLPLGGSDQAHLPQACDVLLQRLFQMCFQERTRGEFALVHTGTQVGLGGGSAHDQLNQLVPPA